jgi:hypothetical protein
MAQANAADMRDVVGLRRSSLPIVVGLRRSAWPFGVVAADRRSSLSFVVGLRRSRCRCALRSMSAVL